MLLSLSLDFFTQQKCLNPIKVLAHNPRMLPLVAILSSTSIKSIVSIISTSSQRPLGPACRSCPPYSPCQPRLPCSEERTYPSRLSCATGPQWDDFLHVADFFGQMVTTSFLSVTLFTKTFMLNFLKLSLIVGI